MTRGANQDYVIDYNSGTVTFMPKRIITADLRVVVEFQYSERSFQRSMVDAHFEWNTKKVTTFFNLYSEQDSKNQSAQQNLDDKKKSFLAALGDSVDKALYPGFDTVAYDVNRILYELHDTVYTFSNGQPSKRDTFFVYSTDSVKARFALSFTQVGEGQGDYVAAQNTANGRVFAHTLPIEQSGVLYPTGSYRAVIKLVTPQLAQMYTLGAEYAINAQNKVIAEVALSNKDVNTFSGRDKADNLGTGARLTYTSEVITKRDTGKVKQKLNLEFNYEFAQNRFRPIERYRNVEFARDFNLNTPSNNTYNEHIASATATYSFINLGTVSYRFRTFIQDSVYKGYENYLATQLYKKGLSINLSSSYLHSDAQTGHSDFIRPRGDVSYSFKALKGMKTGISFDHEINMYREGVKDTFNRALSHLWQNYKYYIGSLDTTKNQYRLEYTLRMEQAANQKRFDNINRITHTINFLGSITTVPNQSLNWNLTYRRVDDKDSLRATQDLKNYYLGRIDYNFAVLKGLIRSTTLYEIGAGREQKVQLVYLVSPNNTGDYVWVGKDPTKPKQLSDFVPLQYRTDTSYVRSFAVTPEFYAVNSATLNEVLNINPASLLRNAKGFGKFIARFSIFSSIQLTKKIYANGNVQTGDYFNPFPTGRMDTNIVSLNLNSRNSIYFNRLSPKVGGQVDLNYSRGRTLLTAGIENRQSQSVGLTVRWNIYKQLNIQASYTNGLRANESDFYKTQQYRFIYNETNSELSYLFKSAVRVAASYYYGFKVNKIPEYGGQFAVINQVSADVKYNRHNKTTVGAKVSYSSIGYNDKAFQNEQAQYAMLEGLKNGNNFVWSIGFEQKLFNAIQLILSYDGRQTGSDKAVHTGKAELRAIF
jgi:hypothetical protein